MKNTIGLLLLTLGLLISCEDPIASGEGGSFVKMVIGETQCANPWEVERETWRHVNNIKAYLASEGVNAAAVEVVDVLPPDQAVCMACTCTNGNNIYISVPIHQREKAEALGFSKAD